MQYRSILLTLHSLGFLRNFYFFYQLSGVSIRRNGSFIQLPTTLDGMEEIHINLEISTKEVQ